MIPSPSPSTGLPAEGFGPQAGEGGGRGILTERTPEVKKEKEV